MNKLTQKSHALKLWLMGLVFLPRLLYLIGYNTSTGTNQLRSGNGRPSLPDIGHIPQNPQAVSGRTFSGGAQLYFSNWCNSNMAVLGTDSFPPIRHINRFKHLSAILLPCWSPWKTINVKGRWALFLLIFCVSVIKVNWWCARKIDVFYSQFGVELHYTHTST